MVLRSGSTQNDENPETTGQWAFQLIALISHSEQTQHNATKICRRSSLCSSWPSWAHKTHVLAQICNRVFLSSAVPWTPLGLVSGMWGPAPPRLRQTAVNRRKQRSATQRPRQQLGRGAGKSRYVAHYFFNSHARNELLAAAMVRHLWSAFTAISWRAWAKRRKSCTPSRDAG